MVFLGRFDGILVKPFFEQSTMAPSLAQVHWFGHDAFTKTGPDTIEIAAKIQKNCTDLCIFSGPPSCFTMVVFFFSITFIITHCIFIHSVETIFLSLDDFTRFFTDFISGFQPFWFNEKFNLLLTVNSNENTLKLNWLRVEYRGQSTVAAAAS